LPQDWWTAFGVGGSDLQKITQAIKEKDPRYLLQISPAAYRIYMAFEATANEGYMKDLATNQNTLYLSPVERMTYAAGFTPLIMSQERQVHAYSSASITEHNAKVSEYKRDIIDRLKAKDIEGAQKLIDEAKAEGIEITTSQIKEAIISAKLPRLLRDYQKTSKGERGDFTEVLRGFYQK